MSKHFRVINKQDAFSNYGGKSGVYVELKQASPDLGDREFKDRSAKELAKALNKLKRLQQQEDLVMEMKNRKHYTPPTVKKREARKDAVRREKKRKQQESINW